MTPGGWEIGAYLYFAALSAALCVIDVRTHRLPNRLTLPAYPVIALLLAASAVATGRYAGLLRALLAGATVLGVFLALHLISPRGMGMGDVKLAGPMGATLGWISWSAVLVGTFLGFALGALVGMGLMAAGRANRSTPLPFGPFMLVGAWGAILLSTPTRTL
jgi:leader peptidase (prepilin peptidase)/N-methyltransferase